MSRRPTQIVEIQLNLTEDQTRLMKQLRDCPEVDDSQSSKQPWFRIKSRFGATNSIVIPGSGFATHGTHISVRQIGKLASEKPFSWRDVGLKKDYLCIVERPSGWMAFLSLSQPKAAAAQTKSGKKEPRIHNDAAIFVTGRVGNRTLSGGLPSLGKRR